MRLPKLFRVFFALSATGTALAQPPAVKVVLDKAKTVEAPVTITLVGTVQPARSSRVASELAGVVARMHVREGDAVAEDQPLCSLNVDSLRLQLAAAEARLKSLQARHEELLAGTRKEEIARAQAQYDEAIAERDRWQFERERVENLYKGSDANAKEIYDTRASYLAAEQRRVAAQAALDLAKAGPRKEVIAQAAFEVAEQQAAVERLKTDLQKAEIRAPFQGHIVSRLVEVGEWVPAGGAIVTMVELASVLVWIDVPEQVLPHLEQGQQARVKIDALGSSFEGQIKHIMREADRTARTFPVEVELQNPEGLLAAGMFARATLPAGPSRPALAVPKDAVVTSDGIDRVGVIAQGKDGPTAMLVPVTVGASVGDWITVSSPSLKDGDWVVIRGTESLAPFPMPVMVVDERGTPVAFGGAAPAGAPAQGEAGKE